MSPLKLTIPGHYWDTQIHRGRLYLFDIEGRILTLDWDRLVEHLPTDNALKLALVCAFKRSDYLYRVAATGIFHDEEFKSTMNNRFSTLAETPLVIEKKQLKEASLGHQEKPFSFSSCRFHGVFSAPVCRLGGLFASQSGVFSANCNGQTKYPVSTPCRENSGDGPVLALGASCSSLALAAGEEGLWEYDLGSRFTELSEFASGRNLRSLAGQHCSECQWGLSQRLWVILNRTGGLSRLSPDARGIRRAWKKVVSTEV